ncbi:MAG: type 4a pilus biogenesis protein PilO [Planctomycetes bacterium]|nr:type 4a pilus biogenesis protein PilO [Planctomycetota bacterium]
MNLARDTLAFALLLASGVAGYAWFGLRAHERAFDALEERVRVAHRRVDEEEERSAHLEQLLVDVAWLREALEQVRARMQNAEGTPQFLLALAQVLRAQGLDADSIDPGPRQLAPPLLRQAVKLELRGTFPQILPLIAAIEALDPHCRVTELELSAAATSSSAPGAEAALLRARLEVVRFWSEDP